MGSRRASGRWRRDLAALATEVTLAKHRFGLPEDAPVVSYEAGRDGFWLHRTLTAQGVANVVVDSASTEINRRARRAKSDHLDVRKLLTMLLRYAAGERRVWHVVRVPTPAEEDRRQLHRELMTTKRDRTPLSFCRAGPRMCAAIAAPSCPLGLRTSVCATSPRRLSITAAGCSSRNAPAWWLFPTDRPGSTAAQLGSPPLGLPGS